MSLTRETFDAQRRPRFGTANPERMQLAFWEWMIRGEDMAPPDESSVFGKMGLVIRDGIIKSGYGPSRARDLFQVPRNRDDGPIWTFDRMGRTRTELEDGRLVCVGGEHEDYYDPDFYIYNDVVVLGPDEQIAIYGYPRELFRPTDSHTASLVGDRIILIGCLGYPEDRRPGHTPVYALDLADFHIAEIPTTGEAPGWLFEHEAEESPDGVITIRAGQVIQEKDGERRFRRNIEEFALDTRNGVWRQLTQRNWLQFSIHPEDGEWFEQYPEAEQLLPRSIEHTVEQCEDWNRLRFVVEGVPVSLKVEGDNIEVIIEGELPTELAGRIVEEVRANTEATIQRRCVVRQV